jgi:hypothetical protein
MVLKLHFAMSSFRHHSCNFVILILITVLKKITFDSLAIRWQTASIYLHSAFISIYNVIHFANMKLSTYMLHKSI